MIWVAIVLAGLAVAGMNWWPLDPADGQMNNCGVVTYY